MKAYRKFICIILLFGIFNSLSAQIRNPNFAKHLVDQGDYHEVIDLYKLKGKYLKSAQQDSMEFYNAWSLFHLKQLPEAIISFKKVSAGSSFYSQSCIFSSWSNLYLSHSDEALQDLYRSKQSTESDSEVFQIQKLAVLLHQRDFILADQSMNDLLHGEPFYTNSLDELNQLLVAGLDFKPKSIALAGLFSGLLPGSGKIYAGEKGAGISSFLILAGMGGIAAENILKSGLTSWNSILFTSLFGVFYLGNIYGSMISIKTYRERFNEGYNQAILATVLLPLRDHYR